MDFTKEDIKFAVSDDAEDWMESMFLAIDEKAYLNKNKYV